MSDDKHWRRTMKLFRPKNAFRLAGTAALVAIGIAGIQYNAAGGGNYAARAESPETGGDLNMRPTVRLISQTQYANTIHQIFGDDIDVSVRFAPVNRVDGLTGVGASSAILTGGGLDPLEASGRAIAEQIVAPERRGFLIPCKPQGPDRADAECARAFFSQVGPLLFRRPLTDAELADVVDLANQAVGPAGNFYDGLAYGLSGMLVSPEFLFITEVGEPDPDNPGEERLDAYSKASRLSFLLWNSSPDTRLLEAADRGELHTKNGLRKQVDRMIASPLFEKGVRAFFDDFLVLEAFDTLAKDNEIYPALTIKAIGEAREQLLRTVVDHLVARHGDYRDLFTTRKTFLSSDLAVLYDLPVDLGSQGWVPYEFDEKNFRSGILTQIAFLSQYAHPGRSSATRRGRAIREVLLCQKVPDPPPNVDFSNFEGPKAGKKTARQRLSVHNENPVCAGCHSLTDPIGLALENFDGAGQFRTTELGQPIDASGELDGAAFHNAVGLGGALRDNPDLKSCVVNRVYAYSLGRKLSPAQERYIARYEEVLDDRGYHFDELLRLIIFDNSFFRIGTPILNEGNPQKTAFAGGSDAP